MSDNTDRVAAHVVTSENLAQFNSDKLGLVNQSDAAEAQHSEPEEVDKIEQEDKTTDEVKEKKPKQKLQLRFSEITKQREEAREEARRERDARETLEAKLKALESGRVEQNKPDNVEPKPEDFDDMYQYAKALAEYTAEKKLAERDNQERLRKASVEQEIKFKSWADRVKSAKDEMPDFDEMIQSSDVQVTDVMRDAIMDSESGPKILYYLAENPEHAKKLADMGVISAAREIGKLESLFEKKVEKQEIKSVVRTKAPAPINPLRGALNTVDAGIDADGNFVGTYQQWKEARMAKRIR